MPELKPNRIFKQVESDQDWIAAIALRNAVMHWDPITVEEARSRSGFHPAEAGLQRFIMMEDERPVGHGTVIRAYWLDSKDRMELIAFPAPGPDTYEIGLELVEFLVAKATETGAKVVGSIAFTSSPEMVQVFKSLGFSEGQHNPVSALKLQEFDDSRFAREIANGNGSGWEIRTLTELSDRFPDAWIEMVWRLEMDLMADVPLQAQFTEIPLETYRRQVLDPHFDRSSSFIALVDDEWVGMTRIHRNHVDPKLAATGLTGVRKPYRRQGIARALKLHALQWAKKNGIERVGTDNEANNPMLKLNVELGFRTESELILFERKVLQ